METFLPGVILPVLALHQNPLLIPRREPFLTFRPPTTAFHWVASDNETPSLNLLTLPLAFNHPSKSKVSRLRFLGSVGFPQAPPSVFWHPAGRWKLDRWPREEPCVPGSQKQALSKLTPAKSTAYMEPLSDLGFSFEL